MMDTHWLGRKLTFDIEGILHIEIPVTYRGFKKASDFIKFLENQMIEDRLYQMGPLPRHLQKAGRWEADLTDYRKGTILEKKPST